MLSCGFKYNFYINATSSRHQPGLLVNLSVWWIYYSPVKPPFAYTIQANDRWNCSNMNLKKGGLIGATDFWKCFHVEEGSLDVLFLAPSVETPSCPYKEIDFTSTQEKWAWAISAGEGPWCVPQANIAGPGTWWMMGRGAWFSTWVVRDLLRWFRVRIVCDGLPDCSRTLQPEQLVLTCLSSRNVWMLLGNILFEESCHSWKKTKKNKHKPNTMHDPWAFDIRVRSLNWAHILPWFSLVHYPGYQVSVGATWNSHVPSCSVEADFRSVSLHMYKLFFLNLLKFLPNSKAARIPPTFSSALHSSKSWLWEALWRERLLSVQTIFDRVTIQSFLYPCNFWYHFLCLQRLFTVNTISM